MFPAYIQLKVETRVLIVETRQSIEQATQQYAFRNLSHTSVLTWSLNVKIWKGEDGLEPRTTMTGIGRRELLVLVPRRNASVAHHRTRRSPFIADHYDRQRSRVLTIRWTALKTTVANKRAVSMLFAAVYRKPKQHVCTLCYRDAAIILSIVVITVLGITYG